MKKFKLCGHNFITHVLIAYLLSNKVNCYIIGKVKNFIQEQRIQKWLKIFQDIDPDFSQRSRIIENSMTHPHEVTGMDTWGGR